MAHHINKVVSCTGMLVCLALFLLGLLVMAMHPDTDKALAGAFLAAVALGVGYVLSSGVED